MLTSGPQLQGRCCSGMISLLMSSFHTSSSAASLSLQGFHMREPSPAVPFPQGYQKHTKGSCEKQQE